MKIDFHDFDDLDEVIYSYSVAPDKPGDIIEVFPGGVLYVDQFKKPCEIKWLDCYAACPKPNTSQNTIHTNSEKAQNLCYVKDGNKKLLFFVGVKRELNAFDIESDKLEWCVKGRLPENSEVFVPFSITADGNGHIFVCDLGNRCIQMFSASGKYMRALMKEGDQDIGMPTIVYWNKTKSCLMVLHIHSDLWHVSKVDVL